MIPLIKYSLLAVLIFICIRLSVYFTHSQLSVFGIYSGLIALFLLALPLILAIKDKRDNELGGFITLREVMSVGFRITMVSAIFIGVFTFLYFKFLDHETESLVIDLAKAGMKKENKPQEEIDIQVIAIREFYSPFSQVKGALFGVLTAGLILSFISSTFLVKNPPVSEN